MRVNVINILKMVSQITTNFISNTANKKQLDGELRHDDVTPMRLKINPDIIKLLADHSVQECVRLIIKIKRKNVKYQFAKNLERSRIMLG